MPPVQVEPDWPVGSSLRGRM